MHGQAGWQGAESPKRPKVRYADSYKRRIGSLNLIPVVRLGQSQIRLYGTSIDGGHRVAGQEEELDGNHERNGDGDRESGLQDLAKRHLWMHFTRHGALRGRRRADHRPRRGPLRVGRARATATSTGSPRSSASTPGTGGPSSATPPPSQVAELDFFTLWSYAHPRAIELAARIASLAPADLNRVFFTNSGSEAVESAIKLARAYHQRTGSPAQDQVHHPRGRLPRHHPRRARGDRHLGSSARSSSRSCPAGSSGAEHEQLPLARGPRPALGGGPDRGEDPLRAPRHRRRGHPRAAPERGRVHSAAGWLLPARAGDLRPAQRAADLRRGDLRLGPPGPLVRLPALRLRARTS